MDDSSNKKVLRARDFWSAISLFLVSVFFLVKTNAIPFFDSASAGVDSAQWYTSAALVPYGIFVVLLLLSLSLLYISIKDGGAKQALSVLGLGVDGAEISRLCMICLILAAYIFGLVPRVDFILSSALLITALIWGFHRGLRLATYLSTVAIVIPALYALVKYFDRAGWAKPHDDDWLTLFSFVLLTLIMLVKEKFDGTSDRVVRATPIVAILCPLILVLSMAFGFRQNVPNRTGLVFKQIEYHYYVTVRPLWQGR